MNISENILSHTFSEEERITSTQLELSCLIQSFCTQVTDGYMLASIASGGLFGTLAKNYSSKFFVSLFSKSVFSSVLAKGSAITFACFVEGLAIQQIPLLIGKESSNEGWQGWIHLSLTVLSMKTIGLLPIQNRLVRHGVQNITLLTLDSVCGTFGLIEESHKTWIEATVSAEIVGCQMMIGSHLLKCTVPNLSHYEAAVDLEYQIRNKSQGFKLKKIFSSLFPKLDLPPLAEATNGIRTPLRLIYSETHHMNEKGSNILMIKKGGGHSQNIREWRSHDAFFEKRKKAPKTQNKPLILQIESTVETLLNQEPLGMKVIDTYRYCSENYPSDSSPISVAEYKYNAKKYLEKNGELNEQQIKGIIDLGVMHFSNLGRFFFIKDSKVSIDRAIKSFSQKTVEIPEKIKPTNKKKIDKVTIAKKPILETEAEWAQRNKITEIKPTKSYLDFQTVLGERIVETLKILQLGHRPSCRLGGLHYQGLYQIKNGEIHPTLEIFYRLIGLFHTQARLLRIQGVEIPPILAISFYELYCPELLAMPCYDRTSNTFFVEMEVDELQRALKTSLSEYLRQKLKEREIEINTFAKMVEIKNNRFQSIISGTVYQLNFSEIVSFARELRVNLDFFYLLARKETGDFVRIISRKTGNVLSEPCADFEGKTAPTAFKQQSSTFGKKIASYKTRWGLTSNNQTARILNIPPETYKSYLNKGTLPNLETFYKICRAFESNEKKAGKSRTELLAERIELYFARNPEIKKLNVLNHAETRFVIHLPKIEEIQWSYQVLRETTFGSILDRIIKDIIKRNLPAPELSNEESEKTNTRRKIAERLKVKKGMMQDLLDDRMLEIDWEFIEYLNQLVTIELEGSYHPTFLSTIANPIILDLVDEVIDQHGTIIRPAQFDEPFDFQYRYELRLKSYKGKEYKATRKSKA